MADYGLAGPLRPSICVAKWCCLPLPRLHRALPAIPAEQPPTGPDWVHEIKHDGYRLMARRDPIGIRLLTRNGYDWSPRYPLIVEAVNRLNLVGQGPARALLNSATPENHTGD